MFDKFLRALSPLLVISANLFLISCSEVQDTPQSIVADKVLTGGKIFTVNEAEPWAEAIAVKDGRIIFVGSDAEAATFLGPETKSANLDGRLVLPGLVDGHTHPGFERVERYVTLPGETPEEFLTAVREYSESNPGDDMIRLCCWNNTWYVTGKEGPHKDVLDTYVSDRPVWINSSSWHSSWLNSKALETIGVNDDTPDPQPGVAVYYRDAAGELTGWVKEGAAWQHFAKHFPADIQVHQQGIVEFLDTLIEHGVTTVYDGGNFGYDEQVYSFLSELDKSGTLPVRYEGTYQIFTPERRFQAISEMKRLQSAYGGERLTFRTIKLFMDGINENRTGAMLEPLNDDPDYVGNTMMSVEELRDFLIVLHAEKLDIHIHIIGDMAARRVFDGVEAAKKIVGDDFYPRVTAAHIEIADPADYGRFAELDIIANFTPWWHGVDVGNVVDAAFGPERAARTYIAKPLFDSGALVTFSSDDWNNMDVLTPFLGMQVAHNRQYPREWMSADEDPTAIRPPESEKLDLELMVKGYTINGAHQFRLEEEIGTIEVGKSADLVVLDENIFEMDRYAIYKVKPLVVMMEGELVKGKLP